MPTIRPIVRPKPGQLSVSAVPAEVVKEVEDAYAYLVEHPDQVLEVEFDVDQENRNLWLAQARTYCEHREPRLWFRVSPVRGAPANMARVNIENYETYLKRAEETKRIREAAASKPAESDDPRYLIQTEAGSVASKRGRPRKTAA